MWIGVDIWRELRVINGEKQEERRLSVFKENLNVCEENHLISEGSRTKQYRRDINVCEGKYKFAKRGKDDCDAKFNNSEGKINVCKDKQNACQER